MDFHTNGITIRRGPEEPKTRNNYGGNLSPIQMDMDENMIPCIIAKENTLVCIGAHFQLK
jgi:hypothetical protein